MNYLHLCLFKIFFSLFIAIIFFSLYVYLVSKTFFIKAIADILCILLREYFYTSYTFLFTMDYSLLHPARSLTCLNVQDKIGLIFLHSQKISLLFLEFLCRLDRMETLNFIVFIIFFILFSFAYTFYFYCYSC